MMGWLMTQPKVHFPHFSRFHCSFVSFHFYNSLPAPLLCDYLCWFIGNWHRGGKQKATTWFLLFLWQHIYTSTTTTLLWGMSEILSRNYMKLWWWMSNIQESCHCCSHSFIRFIVKGNMCFIRANCRMMVMKMRYEIQTELRIKMKMIFTSDFFLIFITFTQMEWSEEMKGSSLELLFDNSLAFECLTLLQGIFQDWIVLLMWNIENPAKETSQIEA